MDFMRCLLVFLFTTMAMKVQGRSELPHPRGMSEPVGVACQTQEDETFHLLTRPVKDQLLRQPPKLTLNLSVWSNETTQGLPGEQHVCPWEYVLVTNPDWSPSVSVQARCLPAAYRVHIHPVTGRRLRTKCREVQYFRWVMFRSQEGKWRWKLYPVSVGCTEVYGPIDHHAPTKRGRSP